MNSEISLPTNQTTNPNLPLNAPLLITSPINSKVWDADQFKRDVIKILTTPSINVNHKPSFKRMSAEKSDFLKENNSKSITAQRSKSDDTKHQQNDDQDVSTKKPLHSFNITRYTRPLNETNKEDKILPLKRKVKVTPPLQTKKLKLTDQSNPPKSLKKTERGHPHKVKEAVPYNTIALSSPEKSPKMKNEGKKTAGDEGTPVSTTTENASEWVIELEISPIKESNSSSDAQETNQHEPKEEILPIADEMSNNSSQNNDEGSTFLFEEGYEMMIECYSEEDDFVNIHQVMKSKKEYNMIQQGGNIEDAESIEKIFDPVESEIRTEGGDYQAEIPSLRMKKYKKPVKLIWSPEMVQKEDFERYTEKISKLFRVASDRLNHEILIEILLQNGLHIENAIECVKRNLDVVRREVVLRNRNSV